MWLWRTVGGLLMVASHVVFAANVWAMRPQPAAAPAMATSAVRSPA
jgi:hypothetical protein